MSSPSHLNLYLVTFNCGRELVNSRAFGTHFFDALPSSPTPDHPPDLIVLHLQEIASLAVSFSASPPYRHCDAFETAVNLATKQRFPNWTANLSGDRNGSKNFYASPTTHHAGMTAIMLFARKDLKPYIESSLVADVGVGMQKMGNKGAAAIRIGWRLEGATGEATSKQESRMHLTFVSAHLAPMEEATDRRNQDFVNIVAGLVFEGNSSATTSAQRKVTGDQDSEEEEPLLSTEPEQPAVSSKLRGIYEPDTHLFFAGDLNYRTSATRPVHDGSDEKFYPQPSSSPSDLSHYTKLLPRDQLAAQHRAGKTLHGLTEASIDFPPTYKYSAAACSGKDVMLDSEVSRWKWSTHRWPSWCDRIFYSPSTSVKVLNYTALPLFATSDHRPVALVATVPLQPVHNPEFASQRPVDLDPDWKINRRLAVYQEQVVGGAVYAFTTREGGTALAIGCAQFATIFLAAYALFRVEGWRKAPMVVLGVGALTWAFREWKQATLAVVTAVAGLAVGWGFAGPGGSTAAREVIRESLVATATERVTRNV